MNTIWNDIKSNFKNGSSFTRLLYINIILFVVYMIIHVPLTYSGEEHLIDRFIENYLKFPENINEVLNKPWTFLSYMFLHNNIFHLFFNMIWLYFGSKIFLQFFDNKQLITTYIFGGIIGAISFSLFHGYVDISEPLSGSSASVVAIIFAAASYQPNYNISVSFLGNIKLKYIAWLCIFLFYINLEGRNPGGNIAHLGGALYGYLYIILLKKGYDISVNFYNLLGFFNFTKKKIKRKTNRKKRSSKGNDDLFRSKKSEKQKKINIILEKISTSGYDSLTKEEKELLFKESK